MAAVAASATTPMPAAAAKAPLSGSVSLPDKANFAFDGTHLNAAYTHPVGIRTRDATEEYISSRMREADRNWPARNSRNEAVALFAQLINAQPTEVAVVPSTLEGENLVAASGNRLASPDPWTLEKIHALFPRLAERGSNMGVTLSGGEQQMLAIGRALMTNPRLLILDEATEGLAPLIRDEIWNCL